MIHFDGYKTIEYNKDIVDPPLNTLPDNPRVQFLLSFLDQSRLDKDNVDLRKMLSEYDKGEDDAILKMQDICSYYIQKRFRWMTGIGLMDAMDTVYNGSIENGLIKEIE